MARPCGTDPNDADSDHDGLKDGEEAAVVGANPLAADSDGDGLSDFAEVRVYQTLPGLSDTDGDGMADAWETQYNLNPLLNDAAGNLDGDSLNNYQEYLFGCNPALAENVSFVSTNGNDLAVGTLTAPWRTILRGVQQMAPGSHLVIRAGQYDEPLKLNDSQNGLNEAQRTTVSADGLVSVSYMSITGRSSSLRVRYLDVKGFTVTNANIDSAILLKNAARCRLLQNTCRNINFVQGDQVAGLQMQFANDCVISSNRIGKLYKENYDVSSAVLAQSCNNLLEGNDFSDNLSSEWSRGCFGVVLRESASNTLIRNTIRNNQQTGHYNGARGDGVGLVLKSAEGTILRENDILSNKSAAIICYLNTTNTLIEGNRLDSIWLGEVDGADIRYNAFTTDSQIHLGWSLPVGHTANEFTQSSALRIKNLRITRNTFYMLSNPVGAINQDLPLTLFENVTIDGNVFKAAFNTANVPNLSSTVFLTTPGGVLAIDHNVHDHWYASAANVPCGMLNRPVEEVVYPFDGSNPAELRADPDLDGLSNLEEYLAGTNPFNADTDQDGMTDVWEIQHGLQAVLNDAAQDADLDGFSNIEEFQAQPSTDPADTASVPAGAKYVALTGSPTATGTLADPYQDIATGLANVSHGMRVVVLPGTYRGGNNKNLDFGGKNVVVKGLLGAEATVIDCEGSGRGFFFHSGETCAAKLQGFTICHGLPADGVGGGMRIENADPTIEECIIKECRAQIIGGGIYATQANPLVTACLLRENFSSHGAAIYLADAGQMLLANSIVAANIATNGDIVAFENAGPQCVNNTLVANAAFNGAVIYAGANSEAVLINNIVAFNSSGIRKETNAQVDMSHNCVYGNIAYSCRGFDDPVGRQGNLAEDPRLSALEYGDARLAVASPCIDAGAFDALPSHLMAKDGQPRVVGAKVDIGAYESSGVLASLAARVIRVKPSGNDAYDGSTWSLAKRTIQSAIDEIRFQPNGVELWVAAGVYRESLLITNAFVSLYGGFAGLSTETSREHRNARVNRTFIDPDYAGRALRMEWTGLRVNVVDGFILQHGLGTVGGGVSCYAASPEFLNCTIQSNRAEFGAGIYLENSSAFITNCVILKNLAVGNPAFGEDWPASAGGGVMMRDSSAEIRNCRIAGNVATNSGCGGGICVFHNSVRDNTPSPVALAVVYRCNIVSNWSSYVGGGISCLGQNKNRPVNHYEVQFKECVIEGNTSWYGGGYSHWNWGVIPTTENSLFMNNVSHIDGAGAKVAYTIDEVFTVGISLPGSDPIEQESVTVIAPSTFRNCTFAGNVNPGDFAVKAVHSSMYMVNCIVWSNKTAGGIATDSDNYYGPQQEVEYSCIEGGYHGVGTRHNGNIAVNPNFVDARGDNYRLQEMSPCINSGDNMDVSFHAVDLDGQPRIVRSVVDQGAYEYPRVKGRGLYVDGFSSILGDANKENALLNYAVAKGIDYLCLYEVYFIFNENRHEQVAAFIHKAKEMYGIKEIGVAGENNTFFDRVAAFNDTHADKFDVLNLEYEYWGMDGRPYATFQSTLLHMQSLANPRGLIVEAYIGWATGSECDWIATNVNRLLVHGYTAHLSLCYSNYLKQRLHDLSTPSHPLEVWPIFSSEPGFMGPWMQTHSLSSVEQTIEQAFNADIFWASSPGIKLKGFQWFDYSWLKYHQP